MLEKSTRNQYTFYNGVIVPIECNTDDLGIGADTAHGYRWWAIGRACVRGWKQMYVLSVAHAGDLEQP